MKTLNLIRKGYIHLLETLEEMALATVARIVPWLIPIAPAWAIKTSVEAHLEIEPTIALLMALAFEGMGIYTSHVAFLCWTWNKSRNKTDNEAPFSLMKWLLSAYLIVGLVLVILIKVYPPSTVVAPAFFLPLGLVVYSAWAVHIELSSWRQAKEAETEERKVKTGLTADIKNLTSDRTKLASEIEKQRAKLASLNDQEKVTFDGQTNSFDRSNVTKARAISDSNSKVRISERRSKILTLKGQKLTNAQIAKELDVSLTTVKNDLKNLNGHLHEAV